MGAIGCRGLKEVLNVHEGEGSGSAQCAGCPHRDVQLLPWCQKWQQTAGLKYGVTELLHVLLSILQY